MIPGKNLVFLKFTYLSKPFPPTSNPSIVVTIGIPRVIPTIADIVQLVPSICNVPPKLDVSEKCKFSSANFLNSGIKSSSNAPPYSFAKKVVSIDSRIINIRFRFFSGNSKETFIGSMYSCL